MRNAAATFDDFGPEPAPRKAAPRKPSPGKPRAAGSAGKGAKGAKRPRLPMQRVARFAAVGMAATMAIGIMVNALVLQKGHHPAPLFGKASVATALPKALPEPARLQRNDVAAEPPAAPAKPRRPVIAARDADAPASDDAIGKLLAGGAVPAQAKSKGDGKTDGKPDGKIVTGAQHALTKLGFKVPATGAVGPATKKAIEAFEKDRHMPVKGELTRRLVKVLAAESGIRID